MRSKREGNAALAPYKVYFTIRGVADLLFNRYNARSDTRHRPRPTKEEEAESRVYRDSKRFICLPSSYVHNSIVSVAKRRLDPLSPRKKSARDLFRFGALPVTELARIIDQNGMIGTEIDYIDKRVVTIQGTCCFPRYRPAMFAGWSARFVFAVYVPELISPTFFEEVLEMAGKFVGVGDCRPQFGRFNIDSFRVVRERTRKKKKGKHGQAKKKAALVA